VQIEDSPWESLRSISVDREGEYPYNLKPRLQEVSHQITCDIKLVDNVKIVTFRSPFKVENDSQVTVELIVVDAHGKATGPARQIGKQSHFIVTCSLA
jgi:vacuolar protein sorting-associated protein 13A/C